MDRVIVDISPADGFHKDKEKFIGKRIVPDSKWKVWEFEGVEEDGWEYGHGRVEETKGVWKHKYFHAIKTKPVGHKTEKSRITPYGNLYRRKLRLRTPRT